MKINVCMLTFLQKISFCLVVDLPELSLKLDAEFDKFLTTNEVFGLISFVRCSVELLCHHA